MARQEFDRLKREQVENMLRPWRRLPKEGLPGGSWIRTLRNALGMSSTQLARRMKVSPQFVRKLEKGEAAGTITLASLRRAAQALECKVAYALVPQKHLEEARRERALQFANALGNHAAHSMTLENQAVSDKQSARYRKALVEALLRGSPRKLWD
jgi:predicted DNA-binding mobile mystery protein A